MNRGTPQNSHQQRPTPFIVGISFTTELFFQIQKEKMIQEDKICRIRRVRNSNSNLLILVWEMWCGVRCYPPNLFLFYHRAIFPNSGKENNQWGKNLENRVRKQFKLYLLVLVFGLGEVVWEMWLRGSRLLPNLFIVGISFSTELIFQIWESKIIRVGKICRICTWTIRALTYWYWFGRDGLVGVILWGVLVAYSFFTSKKIRKSITIYLQNFLIQKTVLVSYVKRLINWTLLLLPRDTWWGTGAVYISAR